MCIGCFVRGWLTLHKAANHVREVVRVAMWEATKHLELAGGMPPQGQ